MNYNQTRETEFDHFVKETLEPFWVECAKPKWFRNRIGLDIHYVELSPKHVIGTVVISPGRVEGYLKYKELAFDFVNQGYQVYIIDHQGQGLSSRRLLNLHKGYVEHFDDYVSDLHQFVEHEVMPHATGNLHLVCHSMGGAIGLRYIEQYPDVFKSASFSSPMWGFISGRFPQNLARNIVKAGRNLTNWFGRDSAYFFGGKNYSRKKFDNNELTTSEVRYEYFRNVYEQYPDVQLGGITFSWLQASIEALDIGFIELEKINTPVIVLQAELDSVVDNVAQDKFCQGIAALPSQSGRQIKYVINGSQHEIFIESDDKRTAALDLIMPFIKQHHCIKS